tara:strand:+ start:86 stop:265 length:180 start_codon:yes stop_codon:yes gene_type:complete
LPVGKQNLIQVIDWIIKWSLIVGLAVGGIMVGLIGLEMDGTIGITVTITKNPTINGRKN